MAKSLISIVVCGRVAKRNKAVSFLYNGKPRFVRVKSVNRNSSGDHFLCSYDIRDRAIKSYSEAKISGLVIHR